VKTLRVLVVGRGRLGTSLARALRDGGVEVSLWSGRGRWPRTTPDVDVALIAVADPFIEGVAERLAMRLPSRAVVLHASGARGADALVAVARRPSGVAHPLVSFAGGPSPTLAGATLVVAGAPRARRAAHALAGRLAMRVVDADVHGPRYHAAAALVANGGAALAAASVRALEQVGIARRDAERAVAMLLRSVAENIASVGLPRALTGPIVRGDASTVAAHRAALDRRTLRIYDALAPVILDVARDAGLPRDRARAIERALTTDRGTRRARRA
jgi:predicted short-subunit dehydrogenase-like oxidoreductase (DUF2520 family)